MSSLHRVGDRMVILLGSSYLKEDRRRWHCRQSMILRRGHCHFRSQDHLERNRSLMKGVPKLKTQVESGRTIWPTPSTVFAEMWLPSCSLHSHSRFQDRSRMGRTRRLLPLQGDKKLIDVRYVYSCVRKYRRHHHLDIYHFRVRVASFCLLNLHPHPHLHRHQPHPKDPPTARTQERKSKSAHYPTTKQSAVLPQPSCWKIEERRKVFLRVMRADLLLPMDPKFQQRMETEEGLRG